MAGGWRGQGRPFFCGESAERAFSCGLDFRFGSAATPGLGKGGRGNGLWGFPFGRD